MLFRSNGTFPVFSFLHLQDADANWQNLSSVFSSCFGAQADEGLAPCKLANGLTDPRDVSVSNEIQSRQFGHAG